MSKMRREALCRAICRLCGIERENEFASILSKRELMTVYIQLQESEHHKELRKERQRIASGK